MTGPGAYVKTGQVIEIEPGDYLYRRDALIYGDNRLRLRVTHVPKTYYGMTTEWVSLLGVELGPAGVDGGHACVVVRTSALPGYRAPAPLGPFESR